ncbi:MAG: cysteine--tRNA ligase, partial [Patescibacteria group bacterium]
MIRLYNYLSRKKELFVSLRGKRVGLYTCGPTVYNYAHIGNLRTYVFEDVLRRALEFGGFRVRQVMNLTDVDDKTIRDAKKAGKSLKEFTEFYARAFFRDIKRLNILPAWKYPRATGHIREMVALIQTLLKKKLAYRTEDGMYFDISRFRPYGKLSRVKQRRLKAGARVSADEYSKEEAQDFALWKAKKPGEPSWPADFRTGRLASAQRGEVRPGVMPGRPGWHIECSAMSMKYLGQTFDIHAGAVDLLFPHHEDEIAQSEAATGKPFVRYFVEGEHLLVDSKKMSKSLGNVYTLADFEKRGFEPMDFRYFVFGAHYRKPLNFTWKALAAARQGRLGLLNAMGRLGHGPYSASGHLKDENEVLAVIAAAEKQFRAAMGDDLNTPKALAILNELLHYGNAMLDRTLLTRRAAKLIHITALEFDRVLGLGLGKRHAA